MTVLDLGGLLASAAADPRPAIGAPDEVPDGQSPADHALAGFIAAVNTITAAAEANQLANWQRRQAIYAAEIARLEAEGGTADPAVIDQLRNETAYAAGNARHCAELNDTAKHGYDLIHGLLQNLLDALDALPVPESQRDAAAVRVKGLKLVAAAVETINAMTQCLLDHYCPHTPVDQFLAAHHLDTTVPPY